MKRKKTYKRDERLSFLNNFIYEFGLVFLIVFANAYGLIMLYNTLLKKEVTLGLFSIYMILFLVFGSLVSSILVYITRARVYSRNIQLICEAAQRVSGGDFDVYLDTLPGKAFKNEIDILKEDFNKMVRELSSIEGLRNDFVADVSHEIKTPLSLIQGYAQLLQNPTISDEVREEYIQRISEAIHKLSDLVDNILKLSRIENQGIVHTETFFIDEQIRCCVLNFETKIEEKNIQLDIDLDEVNITSDKASLELVWNNLLSNAVKFTDYGGKISIKLRKKKDFIVVSFKDNGCGMSEETLKHVFEKFYQGDSSHSSAGNGLGLALVKKIVDLLDGRITVKSKLNKGTEIEIVLAI